MDISTKHLNVTILYDDKVAKVKKYILNYLLINLSY